MGQLRFKAPAFDEELRPDDSQGTVFPAGVVGAVGHRFA